MHLRRIIPILIGIGLVLNVTTSPEPVRAQALQFEGSIAYISMDGNVFIATGDGRRLQVTNDALLTSEFENVTYDNLRFSPDGAYLAFYKRIAGGESRIQVYDVINQTIIKTFTFDEVGLPVEWHKDSDSFIDGQLVDEYVEGSSTSYRTKREFFRQYLSGERAFLFDFYENDNGYSINFDLNTVIYTPDGPDTPAVMLYNWAENSNYPLSLAGFSTIGFWSTDGSQYIYTGDEDEYSVINLKSGQITRTINAPPALEHPFPNGDVYQLSSSALDLSPDAKRLLLSNDYQLYELNLETSAAKVLYTSSHDSPDYRLYGNWSPSGNTILVDEYSVESSYYDDLPGDQGLFVLPKGGSALLAANNAEFVSWLSKDSERLLYKQYRNEGQRFPVELMLFDYANGANIKIGDLPTIYDIAYDPYRLNFIIDWTNRKIDLPDTSPPVPVTPFPSVEATPPVPGQQIPASPLPISFLFFDNAYWYFCGLCLLFLIFLAILLAILLNRSRKHRESQKENEDRSPSTEPRSSSAAQIRRAIELAKGDRLQEAFDILQKIVQSEPNNASAWFNLGGVLASMGKPRDSQRCYLHAKRLGHPRAEEALDWLKQKFP